ncbi:MAG: dATP/dGTP diphosphohydrolase domain-containing protein [Solirubrobacteraceae bacterium]
MTPTTHPDPGAPVIPHLLDVTLDRRPIKPDPTLLPARAILAVSQLLADEQTSHGDRWTARPTTHHLAAALRHAFRWTAGETVDPDSGHSHLVHAAARLLMAVDRETYR